MVSKLDKHGEMSRGYIAMLVVDKPFRKFKIGTELVQRSLKTMASEGADEARGPGPAAASGHACAVQRATPCPRCILQVVLEAETTNVGALRLYQNLGFIRDKRLQRCSPHHPAPVHVHSFSPGGVSKCPTGCNTRQVLSEWSGCVPTETLAQSKSGRSAGSGGGVGRRRRSLALSSSAAQTQENKSKN